MRLLEELRSIILNSVPRYSMVIEMETLRRDSLYLNQKLGLDIDVGFVERGGQLGLTSFGRYMRQTIMYLCASFGFVISEL